MRNYYRVLGLPFGASVDQVRGRYRELARRYHPDVSSDPEAEEKMRLLNEAYHVLSDPQMRLRYHLLVLAHQERQRRIRQKAIQKAQAAYPSKPVAWPASSIVPLYLRYLLIGLLACVVAATAIYHYYHPFQVDKAHLVDYGWSEWPPFLELPPSISEIYLRGNRFSEVPEVVWSLAKLQILDLSENNLQYLSSRITTLRDLEVISLRGNALTTLPRGWGELYRLREIDLRDNRLTQVPVELLDLPGLRRLDLRGNPLSAEMRWMLARRRSPAILWDGSTEEPDHIPKSPRDDSVGAVLERASSPAMPHADE